MLVTFLLFNVLESGLQAVALIVKLGNYYKIRDDNDIFLIYRLSQCRKKDNSDLNGDELTTSNPMNNNEVELKDINFIGQESRKGWFG